jgi:hypothetical protein
MFKKSHPKAVIGKGGSASAFGRLLMPNGEHAVVLDRDVYRRALSAADAKFSEVVKKLESHGVRPAKRKSAA